MGSACCADRSTETGVQEGPWLWCVVLTWRAKAVMLILSPACGWADMSLDCQESYTLAF